MFKAENVKQFVLLIHAVSHPAYHYNSISATWNWLIVYILVDKLLWFQSQLDEEKQKYSILNMSELISR